MRVKITLACQDCKQRNYNMTKDKKTHHLADKGQARETVCGCNRDFRNSRIYHCRCGLPVTDRFNLYCWLGR